MRRSEGGDAEQVEAGLLFLVLELDPEHLTLAELTQRMSGDDPHRREKEAGAVDRATASLQEAGLLSERDGKVVPTRAALRFNALYF